MSNFWDKVPKTNHCPVNWYLISIKKFEETMSKAKPEENKKSKLMHSLMFQVEPHGEIPTRYHKKVFSQYYLLGTEDNPGQPDPYALGTQQLLQVYRAARVQLDGNPDETGRNSVGAKFVARLRVETSAFGTNNRIGAVMDLADGADLIGSDEWPQEEETPPDEQPQITSEPVKEAEPEPKTQKVETPNSTTVTMDGHEIPQELIAGYFAAKASGQMDNFLAENNIA